MGNNKTSKRQIKANTSKPTLDELLESWQVMDYLQWGNQADDSLGGWFAVCNDDGIVAYFVEEKDAFAFRLDKINTVLNR